MRQSPRSNRATLFLAASGAMALAVVVQATPPQDWTDVAQQLAARRAATAEGVVDYRYFGLQLEQARFAELAAIVTASQTTPNPSLHGEVDAWLDAYLPAEREAFQGWTVFDGALWQDQKERSSADTEQAILDATAAGSDAKAGALVQAIRTHSDGVTETMVEDLRVVHLKHAPVGVHPLSAQDMSLYNWQQAMDEGPAAGQSITLSSEGTTHSILFSNGPLDDGSFAVAENSFDEALGFAPVRGRLLRGAVVQLDMLFGYAHTGADHPTRPAVVLRGTRLDDGRMQVALWLIDGWQEWSNAEWLILRKPPVHLEIDYRAGGDMPVVTPRLPSYLDQVPPADQVRVTLQRVLDRWNAYDPETDYNCDGVTNEADAEAALRVLSPSTQE